MRVNPSSGYGELLDRLLTAGRCCGKGNATPTFARGSDLPLHEPHDTARSFGHKCPAIGRVPPEEPFPVFDALGQRQACCLVGRQQRTIGGDPAAMVQLSSYSGIEGSGRAQGGRFDHRYRPRTRFLAHYSKLGERAVRIAARIVFGAA